MALLMTFIINPPVAAINTALTNALNSMGGSSKVILGMLLGGMMAIDMGGPIKQLMFLGLHRLLQETMISWLRL